MKKAVFCAYTTFVFALGALFHSYAYDFVAAKFKLLFKKPVVSVIMVTKNSVNSVSQAIDSILNQTFKDIELILVDDNSTDGTKDLVDSYVKKDSRVIYINNGVNIGKVEALRLGLNQAAGKYIALAHDNTIAVPYRLEREVSAMENYPEIDVLGAKTTDILTGLMLSKGMPVIAHPDDVALDTYFSIGLEPETVIIRKDFVLKNKVWYDAKYSELEDFGFYKDVLENGGKITALDEKLVYAPNSLKRQREHSEAFLEKYKKLQKNKLHSFFNASEDLLGLDIDLEKQCTILTHMAHINTRRKIMNQDILEKRKKYICEKIEDFVVPVHVVHPDWEDIVYFNQLTNRFERRGREDKGTVTFDEKNKTVTLHWVFWPAEIYKIIDSDKWVYWKNEDGVAKKK